MFKRRDLEKQIEKEGRAYLELGRVLPVAAYQPDHGHPLCDALEQGGYQLGGCVGTQIG